MGNFTIGWLHHRSIIVILNLNSSVLTPRPIRRWVTAAMIMIESPSLAVFWWLGVTTIVQLAGGKDTTLSSRLAAAELQLITDHMQVQLLEDQRSAIFLLYWERNDRRLSTPACARGYSRREHITRGNTYPRVGGTHNHRNSSGGTDISGGVAGDMCWGEQKIRGNTYLRHTRAGHEFNFFFCVHVLWPCPLGLAYNAVTIFMALMKSDNLRFLRTTCH